MNDKADGGELRFERLSETRELDLDSVASGMRTPETDPWLDALLNLALELPHDVAPDEVAEHFVDRFVRVFPECAVGACIVDPDTRECRTRVRLPPGAPGSGRDPTRLFPSLRAERILALKGEFNESTLHVATDSAIALGELSPTGIFVDRAADVLRVALERARAFRRLGGSGDDVRRLQSRVIQAEKLASLGQIVAGLVHELNNPLTSIIAYSDYLLKKTHKRLASGEDAADDIERLRRIAEAADRILKFSRELVAYARPTADVPGPLSIEEVIDKALVFCEHEFEESNVCVERIFTKGLPPVRGIAGQLTQVFVNLFTNAAHAMSGRDGRLKVTAMLCDGQDAAVVEVSDNGVGIEAEALPQIFEPFYTTKNDGRGTGLGLSIVRDIVTSHGGNLSAHSVVDEGSVFRVILPLAAVVPSLAPPPRGRDGT
jgi:signal transduction histidine kinase